MDREFTPEELFINKGLSMHPINIDDIQFKGIKVKELLREFAREMSVGFDLFKNSNFEPVEEGNYQGLYRSKKYLSPVYTPGELYNLYLEHLNSKP